MHFMNFEKDIALKYITFHVSDKKQFNVDFLINEILITIGVFMPV